MSKAVRIREHLYAEIEALAKMERRSLISQLEILLEQALSLQERSEADAPSRTGAAEPIHGGAGEPVVAKRFNSAHAAPTSDPHFKPDWKK